MPVVPFNPLDKENLGISVGNALLSRCVAPLGQLTKFSGAGIYAIYYVGDFPAYKKLAKSNSNEKYANPIYVGKAVPAGSRKGAAGDVTSNTFALYNRLAKHASTISEAKNLDLKDFYCRFLVVDDIWIPLGESLMIAKFAPAWNQCVDGFGNNDPGKGRYQQLRSKWDVIHQGRSWADKCQPRTEPAGKLELEAKIFLDMYCRN